MRLLKFIQSDPSGHENIDKIIWFTPNLDVSLQKEMEIRGLNQNGVKSS